MTLNSSLNCAVLAIDHPVSLCEIMKIAIAGCKPYCGEDLVVYGVAATTLGVAYSNCFVASWLPAYPVSCQVSSTW